MPPSNPWGKKPNGNVSTAVAAGSDRNKAINESLPKTNYEEIQADELIALASIYGDDFRHIEKNSIAWQKPEPSFEICVKSSNKDIAMTLAVTLTATYPRTPPLLSIKNDDGLTESLRFKIQKVIETKPKELLAREEPMIMEIVNICQDILEDAAQAKAAGQELPSLEEERAAHQAAASQLVKTQKEAEEQKRNRENQEEERVLNSLVIEEMKRQKARAKETKRKNNPAPILTSESPLTHTNAMNFQDFLTFDQAIELDTDNQITFQTVSGRHLLRQGSVSKCFTVQPIVPGEALENLPRLVLKQTDLGRVAKEHILFKKQLQSLEIELETLKKVRHRSVLSVLNFKVHRSKDNQDDSDSSWTVSILSEYAEKGSLEEFLSIAGTLGVARARSWTIELLDALRYLHENGVIHEDLHTGNILLVRDSMGDVRLKIADAGYQRKLHNLAGKKQATDTISLAKSAYWFPPEVANTDQPQYSAKTDVWDFGVLFLQMIFGLDVLQKYTSPMNVAESLALSDSLNEFVQKLFKPDPKKRPRAFELSSSEFLATDAPIIEEDISAPVSRFGSVHSISLATPRRPRRDSMNVGGPFSRYKEDFVEEGRLGKGGFGEVVKARKKLDGQIYAIKKITQKSSASLTEVLKEVRLLSQLSHPSVVRYYNTWTEEVISVSDMEDDEDSDVFTGSVSNDVSPGSGDSLVEFGASTGGLDFMSSSGYPEIEFGYDDDSVTGQDESEEDDTDDDDLLREGDHVVTSPGHNRNALALKRTRSSSKRQRSFKTILYISMEYCEKRTLRDLIKRNLAKDNEEIWRLFRQILEGLVHIHGLNIVHRDLKPENVFIDAASNVRIGDFGLATSGQYSASSFAATNLSGDMTKSIGTAAYVAPEVKSSVGGTYTSKVDMYSLGIIFFEMCYKPIIGMERAQVVEGLRQKKPEVPSDFDMSGKQVQLDIIMSLLSHSPKERPSSSELLQSGKLPVQMESETIRQTLAGLSDPRSPYYSKMMSALFSRPIKHAKDVAWDMDTVNPSASDLLLQGVVKQKLTGIFRHHGALETPRIALFPRSSHYDNNAVQLLDPNGTLVQLPFDLTLAHARTIAKHQPAVSKSFAFGPVFRDRQSGGQPQSYGEVDFDIVSSDSLDLALKEAEVIKVLDEIVMSFPSLGTTQMCFHLNHADLLDIIFSFCRIPHNLRPSVSETLSKLNMQQYTWQKIKVDLRSSLVGVSGTSVDELQRFDFRDTPSKAFQKLKTIFEGTEMFERASSAIAHLRDVNEYCKRFGIKSKIYIKPLASLKEKFCKGGVIFSCIYDRKVKDVFAAGGRYDSLIRENRHKTGTASEDRHAVGFSLSWEKLARLPKPSAKGFLKKPEEELQGIWTTKRCDILVASHDPGLLRTIGIDVVQDLWANNLSAELSQDSRSPEELLSVYRDENYSWIAVIKQDSIKVKTLRNKDVSDVDLTASQLVPWFLAELRERDHRDGTAQRMRIQRNSSHHNEANSENEQDVRVLVAGTKSKKANRRNVIEQSHGRAMALVQSFLDGPIAAIEVKDEVMELIRKTRLSDPESWRKVSHAVPTTERGYIGEVHDLLTDLAAQNKGKTRNAFVHNFRTGMIIYYDLAA